MRRHNSDFPEGNASVACDLSRLHRDATEHNGDNTSIVRLGFSITASFFGIPITCTYRTSNVSEIFNREARGTLTTAVISGVELVPDEAGCPRGGLSATSNRLTVLDSATRIAVTLI